MIEEALKQIEDLAKYSRELAAASRDMKIWQHLNQCLDAELNKTLGRFQRPDMSVDAMRETLASALGIFQKKEQHTIALHAQLDTQAAIYRRVADDIQSAVQLLTPHG